MRIRSKAPLRIGLAGGGSDVSPYSDLYGGAILNATLDMYAYATIEPREDGRIVLNAVDRGIREDHARAPELETTGPLDLVKGIYNRVVREFALEPMSFELTTHVDAPPGSGLGSSSTLVAAILGAFTEWLNLPLGEYDLAHLAYQIEREDMDMAGGKQDQYSATFGGVNFMEFYADDKVIVNPLRIKPDRLAELSYSLLLYWTEISRSSSEIIEQQRSNVERKQTDSVEAMHKIKQQAILMKEALLRGRFDEMGDLLNFGWHHKKRMASGIATQSLEDIYTAALAAGASGGKISGAGGGGYMFFYCPGNTRHAVARALRPFGGHVQPFEFTVTGLQSWTV